MTQTLDHTFYGLVVWRHSEFANREDLEIPYRVCLLNDMNKVLSVPIFRHRVGRDVQENRKPLDFVIELGLESLTVPLYKPCPAEQYSATRCQSSPADGTKVVKQRKCSQL